MVGVSGGNHAGAADRYANLTTSPRRGECGAGTGQRSGGDHAGIARLAGPACAVGSLHHAQGLPIRRTAELGLHPERAE